MSEPFVLDAKPMLPDEMISALLSGNQALDEYLGTEIYANHDPAYLALQRERMVETLRLHQQRVGNRPTYLLRAPGRLNAFLEYLDMCAGDHMSTTIDGDIPVAVSPREDDIISCSNINPLFLPGDISISDELALFKSASWDNADLADTWDNRTRVHPYYRHNRGEWLNYVRCPFLRTGWALPDIALKGIDMTFGPASAPFRAGTSSSSAIVVLSFLALYLANKDSLPSWTMPEICSLLGEAEWYVGTHGGANDQTTILRNLPNGVLYNRHSLPALDSDLLPCLTGVRVVLADSLWEANKALGANHIFNLRKGWMDLGDDLMQLILRIVKRYLDSVGLKAANKQGWLLDLINENFGFMPERYPAILESNIKLWDTIFEKYHKFGSLAEDLMGVPHHVIEELIYLLPEEITAKTAGELLGKDTESMQRDYTLPYAEEGGYRVRNAALFFYKENRIGRRLEAIFLEADSQIRTGELSAESPEYDAYRLEAGCLLEQLQETIRDDFQVSIDQLDLLLEIAKDGPGYLGGKLTGAGSGGCVSILVREGHENDFCHYLDKKYYFKSDYFNKYRSVLDKLENESSTESSEHAIAVEMKENLARSLQNTDKLRRAVTFSRGACVLALDQFIKTP